MHHFTLAASAFAPDGLHNTSEDYFNQWDPTTLSNTDEGRCFNAGLTLPDDVTLQSVTAYYTEGSDAMRFEVNRQNLAHHSSAEVADFDSAPTSGTPFYTHTTMTVPSDVAKVKNIYAYSVGVCPDGTTTFSGLDIAYTTP